MEQLLGRKRRRVRARDISRFDDDVSRLQDAAPGVSAGEAGPYSSFDPDDSSEGEDLPRVKPLRGLGPSGGYRPPAIKSVRPQWHRDKIPGYGLEPVRRPGTGLEPQNFPGHGLTPRTQFRHHGLGSGHPRDAMMAYLHYNASISRGQIYGADIARLSEGARFDHDDDPVSRGLAAVSRFSRHR
jgi:hypothetical protein